MTEYRTFLNTDPPFLVNVWRRQRRLRGLADRISSNTLEELIFSKPYFDPEGLILALNDGVPVGFVHAGFGPNRERRDLDYDVGIISAIRIVDADRGLDVASGLVDQALRYLRSRGATRCYAGSAFPHAPYYLGMYGGSRIPGVLHDDGVTRQIFQNASFAEQDEIIIFQRRLAGFRAITDRQQMTVRRQYQVTADTDPNTTHWWEACTLGSTARTRFCLQDRKTSSNAATVTFWDMQPLASCWGVSAMGMYDLQVAPEARRSGLGTFLVCESLRALSQQSISLVEAQVRANDDVACSMFRKLGFDSVGTGNVFLLKLKD